MLILSSCGFIEHVERTQKPPPHRGETESGDNQSVTQTSRRNRVAHVYRKTRLLLKARKHTLGIKKEKQLCVYGTVRRRVPGNLTKRRKCLTYCANYIL